MLLPVNAHRCNVKVVDDELVNLRIRGLAAHRSLGGIVNHAVGLLVALSHLLA